MLKIKIIVFLFLFLPVFICAQQNKVDTCIIIQEVEIKADRLSEFGIGSNIQKIENKIILNYAAQSIAELLQAQSSIIINSYGPGGLATASVRGGGTAHNAVIWNGVNIQSPAIGQVNLSLFPAGIFDDISLQYGGSGTLYGSGAVSGIIHFNNNSILQKDNTIGLQLSSGSFNSKSILANIKSGNEKIATSIKFFKQSTENNFPFINTTQIDDPLTIQSNAASSQMAVIAKTELRISKKSLLSANFWYQENNCEIQTLMTSVVSNNSDQADKNLRLGLNYQINGKKIQWKFKSVVLNDNLIFFDPNDSIKPEFENNSLSVINEAEAKYFINENQIINAGVNYTFESVFSDGYNDRNSRNRYSLFASYKYLGLFSKLDLVSSIRQELVDFEFIPFVFSTGVEYNINNNFKFNATASKNYRIPTFNDLYWGANMYAVGNPDLRPESGWNAEIGLHEKIGYKNWRIIISQNAFYTRLRDWIIWLPDSVDGRWKPENKKIGRNYGIELRHQIVYNFEQTYVKLNVNYDWVFSRIKSDQNTDNYNEKPMIYVPEHHVSMFVSCKINKLSANYSHHIYSERYYDYMHVLPVYQLADIIINYSFFWKKFQLTTSFKIKNIWDENYQVIANYAMPGRNFLFSIKCDFTNNK